MSSAGQKLIIIIGKASGASFQYNQNDSASVIEVGYNPTDYSLNKSNTYSEAKIPGLSSPIIQFSQGSARSLTLKLLLDTFTNEDTTKTDIRTKYMTKFDKLINIDSDLHAPPPCKVVWGAMEFVGVAESLDKEYLMFLSDGTAVRARVTVKLKEYLPFNIQMQGAPRFSPDRRKLLMFKRGDNLWQLSYIAYGDPGKWRVIAAANNIENPRALDYLVGQHIIIPDLAPSPTAP